MHVSFNRRNIWRPETNIKGNDVCPKLPSFKIMLLLVVGHSLCSPSENNGEKVAKKDEGRE